MTKVTENKALTQGEHVIPFVLYGTRFIPIELSHDALPRVDQANLADVYEASETNNLPDWASELGPQAIQNLISLLVDFETPEGEGPFEFDLSHRLSDYELVGKQVDDGLPVLKVRRGSDYWNLLPNLNVLELVKQYIDGDNSTVARLIMTIEIRPLSDFVSREPEKRNLRILETWRIISVFKELSVGNPSGAITLTPQETREVSFRLLNRTTNVESRTRNILESNSKAAVETFNEVFKKQLRNEGGTSELVKWSRDRTRQYFNTSSIERDSKDETMTASKISDAITTTTRQLVETLSSKREVTVFSKSESTEVKEEEATETNTLKNPNNGLVITYVYHHLNALYRVHVDLVDIELIYHTGRSIDRPVVISLNEGVQSGLATLVKDDLLNDCVKRVTSIFQDLYADIQAVRYEGDNAFVNHAESSDVNNDLTTRSILLGDRRTEGELPLNLTSRLELLQTGDLHAVPLVSEYSAAEAKTESNGDSKKVAPKNRTA